MSILTILNELEATPSTNDKLSILNLYKNDQLLQRTVSMALDKVRYTYGIRKVPIIASTIVSMTLDEALEALEAMFVTRKATGGNATFLLGQLLGSVFEDDANVLTRVILRDLRCGVGKTLANKVWANCIIKPPYMRCSTYSDALASKIKYPAIIQKKADGRYVSITVDSGVSFMSRSGESEEFPGLAEAFSTFPRGVYIGEMLVEGEDDRAIANGLINSSSPPHDKIYVELWDYLSINAFSAGESLIPYADRLSTLEAVIIQQVNPRVLLIETLEVTSPSEAKVCALKWTAMGLEGGVLKAKNLLFKNHTSTLQLKLKIVCDISARIVGFTQGEGKRAKTFGALLYRTDDSMIEGSVSGFSDAVLEEIHNNREKYLNTIIDITFNDLTKAQNSDSYSLSHPRFTGFREDRLETDNIETTRAILSSVSGLVASN